MTKLKTREESPSHSSRHVHSVVYSKWGEDKHFRHVVTLDPNMAQDAWELLCTNSRAVEYQELPSKLHKNFLRALNRTRTLEKLFG